MGYKVAVLMGGKSLERDISLLSGKYVSSLLESAGHKVLPLDITSELVPTLRSEKPDAAFIALHGKHGEDGTIQSLLEFLGIPFVGTSAQNCRVAWDKTTISYCKNLIASHDAEGLRWPKKIALSADAFKKMGAATALDLMIENMPEGLPLVVKPAKQGSALGASKVNDQDELASALLTALSYDDEVVIEEWIDGLELSVSILGTGMDAYALPPVEIVVENSGMFDFAARTESERTEYFVPVRNASLAQREEDAVGIRSQIENSALAVYRALGMRDFGRVDLLWDGARACILDCSVSPGFSQNSLLPMAARAADLSLEELCSQLVEEAVFRG